MSTNLVLKRDSDPSFIHQVDLLRVYFDVDFYEHQLSIRQLTAVDPVSHYLTDGWHLHLDPSPYFSTEFYLQNNSDVVRSHMNPLLHYLLHGKNENRETSCTYLLEATDRNFQFLRSLVDQFFDVEWYMAKYPSAGTSDLQPIEHYLSVGWLEGLDPSADFSTIDYRSTQMESESSPINPLVHFAVFGTKKQYSVPSTNVSDKGFARRVDMMKSGDVAHQVKIEAQGLLVEKLTANESAASSSRNSDPTLINTSVLNDINSISVSADVTGSTEKSTNYNAMEKLRNGRILKSITGNIDGLKDGKIYGWFLAPSAKAIPFLFVNDHPMTEFDYPVKRPDVNDQLGITGETGFIFEVGGIEKNSKVELYVLCNSELVHVTSYYSQNHSVEENFILQLAKAHEISKKPGSVAITCWDGTHNPLGRAKVLYDVVSSKRPAIIVTYSFGAFGKRPWAPIRNENVCLLMIPWASREIYQQAIHAAGIKFETIWICKPRFPSFELAKLISNNDSSIILDFDDNEEHFSKSENAKNKAYGHATINYSRFLTDRIGSRTAASITLKNEFGTNLVRHARFYDPNRTERKLLEVRNIGADFKIKVGFIGTVRQHKNLTDAARAIKAFNWVSDVQVELHVYGDVNPSALVSELESNGVIVKGNIPMCELYEKLGEMDIILTGFSGNDNSANAVTEYQISSKIGDALSVGRPVLVPEGPSVVDLNEIPGVFLFNTINFSKKLTDAIVYKGEIALTEEFTIDGAFAAFSEAENMARESESAKDVFSILPENYLDKLVPPETLVLLWKQNDSGFYGRRVDQIARSYKRLHPSKRVVILELMHMRTEFDYENLSENYTSEHRMLLEQVSNKRKGKVNDDGVEIHQIVFQSGSLASKCVDKFLLENAILPMNSVLIIFPIVQFYEKLERSFRAYPKIIDVVDNQFYWGGSKHESYRVSQYYMLLRSSESLVFNSEKNRDYFVDNNVVCSRAQCEVIPNWYELPANYSLEDRRSKSSLNRNIIYSGNMNDRIDWNLLDRIANTSDSLIVHLVGTASRCIDNLIPLLENKNVIYHGPLSEKDTLRLTQEMDVAIMPHLVDSVSAYMNPLKLQMYKSIGIRSISTDVPGIEESQLVTICKNQHEFLEILKVELQQVTPRIASSDISLSATKYVELIESRMPMNQQNIN